VQRITLGKTVLAPSRTVVSTLALEQKARHMHRAELKSDSILSSVVLQVA
jgi:hypothetical protein